MTMPPGVVIHGFAGHADSWDAVRAALPEVTVEALTLFGHDPTTPALHAIAFDDEVARIVRAIRALGEPVRLCGYSMGGRVALGVLAHAPELVASAVLVGAHPGLTSDAERRERAASDDLWARLLLDRGISVFAEKWQAQPLFATQARLDPQTLAEQQAIRLRHDAHGLALAMTSLGLARMPSYWHVFRGLQVPVDLVVGTLDTKFAALALKICERLTSGFARVVGVAGTGHNVLLERPELLAKILSSDGRAPLPVGAGLL